MHRLRGMFDTVMVEAGLPIESVPVIIKPVVA